MRRITNQKDLIKNIIQECDCPFFLPAIDRLEGFHPGGPCLYRRVLVPVRINGTVLPTWLYMVGDRWTGSRKEISGGVWR
jgi:hypothetical protein